MFPSIRMRSLKAPNNPRARANLAVAYGMSGLYEPAISEAEKSIGLGQRLNEQYVVAANAIVGALIGLRGMRKLPSAESSCWTMRLNL